MRRLLQEDGGGLPPSDNGNGGIQSDGYPNRDIPQTFDTSSSFTPSMAIILVVLLSAFFFMAFFSIYVRRCTTAETEEDAAAGRNRHRQQQQQRINRGVDPQLLQRLPLVSYSLDDKKAVGAVTECVVCLTDFVQQETLKQLPKCEHVFHQECIDMWLFSHTTCPLCRRSLLSSPPASTPSSPPHAPPSPPPPPQPSHPLPILLPRRPLRRSYSTGYDLRGFDAQNSSSSSSSGLHAAFSACFSGGDGFQRRSMTPPPPASFRRSRSSAALFRYYPVSGSLPLRRIKLSPLPPAPVSTIPPV